MYAATVSSGRTICPTRRPGAMTLLLFSGICSFAKARMFFDAASMAERNAGDRLSSAAFNSPGPTTTVFRSNLSNFFAYSSKALSPRLRTESRIGLTTASASANLAAFRASSFPTSVDSMIRIIGLHHNLVQRIFDDALCTGFLQPRNNVAHGSLVQDG